MYVIKNSGREKEKKNFEFLKKMATTISINDLVDSFNQLTSRLTEINNAVRDLKTKMGYSQVSESLKTVKDELYQHMINNGVKEVQGITISKVKPSQVKRQEKENKIAEKVSTVLENEIDDQQVVDGLVPLVVEAALGK